MGTGPIGALPQGHDVRLQGTLRSNMCDVRRHGCIAPQCATTSAPLFSTLRNSAGCDRCSAFRISRSPFSGDRGQYAPGAKAKSRRPRAPSVFARWLAAGWPLVGRWLAVGWPPCGPRSSRRSIAIGPEGSMPSFVAFSPAAVSSHEKTATARNGRQVHPVCFSSRRNLPRWLWMPIFAKRAFQRRGVACPQSGSVTIGILHKACQKKAVRPPLASWIGRLEKPSRTRLSRQIGAFFRRVVLPGSEGPLRP